MKADLLKAITAKDTAPSQEHDALVEVRDMARAMRDLQHEIKELEERTAEKKKLLTQLSMKDLPDLFDQHHIRSIGLDAEGNNPAYDVVASPYYRAVLPKEEDAGLRWLEEQGHGDMIKRVYTVDLAKDSQKEAAALRKFLEKHDMAFEENETVHWKTLTAFIQEQIEKRHKTPPLEILGATVGRQVKIKPKR